MVGRSIRSGLRWLPLLIERRLAKQVSALGLGVFRIAYGCVLWLEVAQLYVEKIDYCVQEFVSGLDNNLVLVTFVADREGRIPALFMSRKCRQQPADFGTLCVGAPEDVPELRRLTEQYCRQTRYVGPGSMEFKWEDKHRRWLFIENNPRLNFNHGMAVRSGMNLALQQYLLSTGQKLFEMASAPGKRYWIDIPGDLSGSRWRQRRPEWKISWWAIVKSYICFHEAVFNWSDPLPGLLRIHREIGRSPWAVFKAVLRRSVKMLRVA